MEIQMGSFRDLWASECGSVITVQRGERTVVWLLGEIDCSLEPDLALIASLAPRVSTELVIDAAWMTFADGTLARFVATVAEHVEVTARRPTVLLLDLLRITGLRDRVKVDLSLSGTAADFRDGRADWAVPGLMSSPKEGESGCGQPAPR